MVCSRWHGDGDSGLQSVVYNQVLTSKLFVSESVVHYSLSNSWLQEHQVAVNMTWELFRG